MDKLEKLNKQKADIVKEARTLLDKAEEEERDLNEDEQSKYDELMKEIDSKTKAIEREENQIKLDSQINEPADEPPIKNTPQEPEEKRFKSLSEFLGAVIMADAPADIRKVDPRLAEIRAASGMGESVPADGGYLVQTDFASEILQNAYQTGLLASKVTRFPIGANSNGIKINAVDESSRATGSRYGGIQIYPVSEADTVTAKKPKFKQLELELSKIMGLCYLTDELVADTTALEAFVNKAFAEEFGFMIDYYIMSGSGVGQPLGIMNSNCLISVTRSGANTIAFSDITGMLMRFPASSRGKAVWLINQVAEEYLWNMTVSDAGYIPAYMPPGGISGSQYSTIMGRPVLIIEQTSDDVGTTGDIMLADLSQYVMIDKGAMQQASSMHVRFNYDEQVLRFTYRVDGMPWWNSTLTTFGGNNTVSPFVVLSTNNG
ncbi:MAG: phage major capsid protein [Candidatus Pacearchaeota archaeon]|jgi:HK97 family phage major capsid protein